jgi:ribonuclease HI
MPKMKYYVVWKGRKTGIFVSWEECSAQVTGFNGAEYKSFENATIAKGAFLASYTEYKGNNGRNIPPESIIMIGKPEPDSYCVDASCIGNPGVMEYRCVSTTTKEELFHHGPLENGTNNIGEFLAVVHALALFRKLNWNNVIYTDSETAIVWVRNNKCKTKLQPEKNNQPIFELIHRAEIWLSKNDYPNKILKWDTDIWGEIPADYGRK